MTTGQGPIYEVTFFVDREVVADYDDWLDEHVRKSLHMAVIADCRIIRIPDDEDGRAGRVCEHILETDDALDDFVDGPGTDIENDIAAAFGESVAVSSRIMREDDMFDMPSDASPNCLNCGGRLRGQYCGNCGQRSRSRLISLWELVSDAFGDLFEIDSRLWQTLVPLMIRPGRLTHDYLQGRRARFMPPFRMYLVMSLIFFVVAFFDPREELGLLFVEPDAQTEEIKGEEAPASQATEAEPSGDEVPVDEAAQPEMSEEDLRKQQIFEELSREGIIVGPNVRDPEKSIRFQFGDQEPDEDDDCDIDASDVDDLPGWLAKRLTVERMKHICERVQFDDGASLADALLDNVPAALIVLLPLMALVLKALYPLSRRYYVEHLLFFVHFHAFFFLILTLQVLFARLAPLLRIPNAVTTISIVVTSLYVPIYLFVAMRRVYHQGRFVTFLKYIALTVTYLAGFAFTMFAALAIAAFSI